MRLPCFALLGALSATAVAFSCGGTVNQSNSSASTGAGGGTGGATTTTTTTTTVVDAGPDVDNGMVSHVYPAPHPAAPQVITGAGPVLASPKIVPVFFSNEDMTMEGLLVAFLDALGTTKYWNATTSEYGVGPAMATAPVVLTEAAPSTTDDATIQTWLAGKLNGNDPLWPPADDNSVYVLHYPSGTTITQQSAMGTAVSCQTFGGYHNGVTLDAMHNSQNVAYAVIPRCGNFAGLHGVDAVTAAESHELVEAATDPYPMVDPAYAEPDQNHLYWLFALGGGEVGDMCAQFPGVFTKFAELPNVVQRTWSNASAAASHEPCVPALPGEVYFNSAPVLKDNIVIAGIGSMKGVKIPVGSSKTVELDLFSDGDTGGAWDVEVKDFFSLMGQAAVLGFTLDRTSGQNGEKLHLTIDALKKSQYGVGIFIIISSLGQRQSWWIGLVGN
jgi:hypothetical protein